MSSVHYYPSLLAQPRVWLARLGRERSGQAILEVTLCASLILAAFMVMFDFGFMLESNSALQDAAQHAVDYATMHGAAADQTAPGSGCGPGTSGGTQCSAMVNVAKAWLAQNLGRNDIDLSKTAHVCVAWWQPGEQVGGYPASKCSADYAYVGDWPNAEPKTFVTVQIVWTYQPFTPFGKVWSIPLTYTATGAVTY